jgi:enediyne biosynthesis protein E4
MTAGCQSRQNAIPRAAGTARPAKFQFRDVQTPAGITFRHTDGESGRKYFVEQFCSGCGFIDIDNDGFLDIYAVNGAPLPGSKLTSHPRHEMYRNRGDGTFENITDKCGMGSTRFGGGVCAADYDNDGCVELYVTCFGKNHLYKNKGNGVFEDIAEHAGVAGTDCISTSACFFDYDNDGWLDLYVCHYVDYKLADDRFCGKGKDHKSYCGPEVFHSHSDTLYHNNRDGTFTEVSSKSRIIQARSKSLGVVATDIDNDGWMDLYVTCDLEPNLLLINNRDGTFTERGVEYGVAYGMDGEAHAGMGVAAGDYDNDGKIDLFVTNYSFEMNSLYHNTGQASFNYASLTTGIGPPSLVPLGFGAHFADFDNDGWQDMIVANGHVLDDCHDNNQALEYAQPIQLYQNSGGTKFSDVSKEAGPAFDARCVGRGLAVGDYDNDGRIDLLVSCNKGPLRLIHNESTFENNWIKLQLEGKKANRSAVGARVQIKTAAGTQTQEVYSGSSYLSQSDFRLHFGLGKLTEVQEISVRWPGSGGKPGAVEVWRGLEINRIHRLVEGTASTKGDIGK